MERMPKNPGSMPDNAPTSNEKPFFNYKGILPTAVSIAGTIGSIIGIRNIDKHWGAVLLVASSFGDFLDGKLARGEIDIAKIVRQFMGKSEDPSDGPGPENKETGETRLGALVDHTGDKIKMAAIIYELWKRGIAPEIILGIFALSNTFNVVMTAGNTIRHPGESRPVMAGKIGMACQVLSTVSYATGHFLETHGKAEAGKILRGLGAVAFFAGVPFMVKAGKEYAKEALRK